MDDTTGTPDRAWINFNDGRIPKVTTTAPVTCTCAPTVPPTPK